MLVEISELFVRDLKKLAAEIRLYSSDEALWFTSSGISNTGGNLALHICGNLNHFIGALLGDSGYKRDRDAEFNSREYTRSEIIQIIEEVQPMVKDIIKNLDNKGLNKMFPMAINPGGFTVRSFILHLYGHLNYHLGQINYHRRILDSAIK